MENMNTSLNGFSKRAANPEFREEMQKALKKNFRNIVIGAGCVFLAVFLILLIMVAVKYINMGVCIGTSAVILLICIGIVVGCFIALLKDINDLKKDSMEGVILKKSKTRVHRTGKSYTARTKYKVIIKTDDGKKIKLGGTKARTFYFACEEGDRVCYHPGFLYPVEFYNKADKNKNICVFCGAESEANAAVCPVCGKQMLV